MRQSCYIILLLATYTFQSSKGDCSVASETVANGTYFSQRTLCPGDLIFEDNFDYFDVARWQHEITLAGGGNGEFQYYRNNRTNSFVLEGNLHIAPTYLVDDYGEDFLFSGTLDVNGGTPADLCTNPSNYGCSRTGTSTTILNPIVSAKIRTVESFNFRYGTIEVCAKVSSGDWLWPAIWLMPRYNAYGIWPASGEIDVLENRGNKNLFNTAGVNVGTQQVGNTLNWGPYYTMNQYTRTDFKKNNASGFDTDFHTYKTIWNSTGFIFYVDDEQIGAVSPPAGGFWELGELENTGYSNPWTAGSEMAPFDQEFYLIISLAVGGNYFDDAFTNDGGKPWNNTASTGMTDFWEGRSQWEPTWNRGTNDSHLVVDYIRVYAA